VSNIDRSMHRSLWALVAHSLFKEGLHVTINTGSGEGSTVVEPSSHHPKVKGLSPATSPVTWGEKMAKRNFLR
jgi:hypothetical protein